MFCFFIILCCELTVTFIETCLLSLSLESSGNTYLIREQALEKQRAESSYQKKYVFGQLNIYYFFCKTIIKLFCWCIKYSKLKKRKEECCFLLVQPFFVCDKSRNKLLKILLSFVFSKWFDDCNPATFASIIQLRVKRNVFFCNRKWFPPVSKTLGCVAVFVS